MNVWIIDMRVKPEEGMEKKKEEMYMNGKIDQTYVISTKNILANWGPSLKPFSSYN